MSCGIPNLGQDIHLGGCDIVCLKSAYVFNDVCLQRRMSSTSYVFNAVCLQRRMSSTSYVFNLMCLNPSSLYLNSVL